MRKIIYVAATLFAVFLSACSDKEAIVETVANGQNQKAITAATSSVTYNDESAFVSSMAAYGFLNPTQITYNRIGSTAGYTSTYGFNIPVDRQAAGFKWNADDESTRGWRPQGVAGFTWGGRRFILATWYGVGPDPDDNLPDMHYEHKGLRLSIVDITNMSNITYRHILLVQRKENMSNPLLFDTYPQSTNPYTQGDLYCAVTIHAGGVAFFNNKIYVADTGRGARVFDLNNIIDVSGGATSIGKMSDGTLQAFDYGYILPETGWYSLTGASPYSCVELGGGGTKLYFGQYLKSPDNPVVTGYPLSSTGQITTGTPVTISPKDDTGIPVYHTQGVFRNITQTFLTSTGNTSYLGSTARLVRYNDGTSAGTRYRWPHGSEDLYYEASTGFLWCLTEYETNIYGNDNRVVYAVRLSDYD